MVGPFEPVETYELVGSFDMVGPFEPVETFELVGSFYMVGPFKQVGPGGAGSEAWNRVDMIAPVKKFARVGLSTNFYSKQTWWW